MSLCARKKKQEYSSEGAIPWNFRLTLLTKLDACKNASMSSVGLLETMCSVTGKTETNHTGLSRWELEGLKGLMTWVLLTLALFACSPQRLIFRHPKYSATWHQTTVTQPHINGWNSTRESHRNPGLDTQKLKTTTKAQSHYWICLFVSLWMGKKFSFKTLENSSWWDMGMAWFI